MRGDSSATTLPASMGLLWKSGKADGLVYIDQVCGLTNNPVDKTASR